MTQILIVLHETFIFNDSLSYFQLGDNRSLNFPLIRLSIMLLWRQLAMLTSLTFVILAHISLHFVKFAPLKAKLSISSCCVHCTHACTDQLSLDLFHTKGNLFVRRVLDHLFLSGCIHEKTPEMMITSGFVSESKNICVMSVCSQLWLTLYASTLPHSSIKTFCITVLNIWNNSN